MNEAPLQRRPVGRNFETGQRRLVVNKQEDDDIIGIDETSHDNNNNDANVNGSLEAIQR